MNNAPTPRQPPQTLPGRAVDDEQMQRWLRLRRELTELHARLEYLKLMMKLGAPR